jgi:hypothetical protein
MARSRSMLCAALLVAVAAAPPAMVAACANGHPDGPPPSVSPLSDSAFADQVVGLYFDRLHPSYRLVLYDDERYLYWNGQAYLHGSFTVAAHAQKVFIPEMMGALMYDARRGSFGQQVTADQLRELVRVPDADRAAAQRYGRGGAGKSWAQLEAALASQKSQIDLEITSEQAGPSPGT